LPLLGLRKALLLEDCAFLTSVRAIHPTEARGFDKVFNYVEQTPDRRLDERVALDFEAQLHRARCRLPAQAVRQRVKGFPASRRTELRRLPLYDLDSWIYRAGDRGGHWKVDFETDAPQWVEVIVFPAERRAPEGALNCLPHR
jgi:hypothetical protein